MRKIQLLGVAAIALFAFGAFTAVSASAANVYLLAEWLVGNAAVTTELLVEINGELLLEDTKAILGTAAMVLCSGLFDGWVGPNSLDYISEVLNLANEPISNTPGSGASLNCPAQTGCETNTEALVWPVGLPAETEVELLEQAGGPFFVVLFSKELGWLITNCLVLGTAHEDECQAVGFADLSLEGTSLLGTFSEAVQSLNEGHPRALCTASAEETGVVEGTGTFELSGGGELTASSETSEA